MEELSFCLTNEGISLGNEAEAREIVARLPELLEVDEALVDKLKANGFESSHVPEFGSLELADLENFSYEISDIYEDQCEEEMNSGDMGFCVLQSRVFYAALLLHYGEAVARGFYARALRRRLIYHFLSQEKYWDRAFPAEFLLTLDAEDQRYYELSRKRLAEWPDALDGQSHTVRKNLRESLLEQHGDMEPAIADRLEDNDMLAFARGASDGLKEEERREQRLREFLKEPASLKELVNELLLSS